MVHQTYVQRLLLGRSAREPPAPPHQREGEVAEPEGAYVQHFDAHGYPEHRESRASARRLRRAQNDILTTIGVCVCDHDQVGHKSPPSTTPNSSKVEQEQARINVEEHAKGFWFEVGVTLSFLVLPEWSINIRRRVQTFDYYLDVPLWAVVRSEFNHLGLWTFFFAGKLPVIAFRVSEGIVELFFDMIAEYLPDSLNFPTLSGLKHIILQSVMLILFSPLYVATKLQQLGLIQDWRNPLKIYLAVLHVFGGDSRSVSFSGLLRGLGQSPLPLAVLYLPLYDGVNRKLYTYFKAIFARPDNPSTMSYKLESPGSDFDTTDAPVLSLPEFQPSLREELKKDYHAISTAVQTARKYFANLFRVKQDTYSGDLDSKRPSGTLNSHAVTFVDPLPEDGPSSSADALFLSEADDHASTQAIPASTSPPQSPSSSRSDPLSEVNPSAVQVRTRSGSTSTLHMDLEVHLPMAAQEPRSERRTHSAESSTATAIPEKQRSSRARSRAHHRVTALTILPSEEMANFFSGMGASLIMLPLESMLLRRTARIFLESDLGASPWLRRTVYGNLGLNSTRHSSWQGLAAYSTRIALCYGIESVLCLGAWHIGGWFVLWLGKASYGWGKL